MTLIFNIFGQYLNPEKITHINVGNFNEIRALTLIMDKNGAFVPLASWRQEDGYTIQQIVDEINTKWDESRNSHTITVDGPIPVAVSPIDVNMVQIPSGIVNVAVTNSPTVNIGNSPTVNVGNPTSAPVNVKTITGGIL